MELVLDVRNSMHDQFQLYSGRELFMCHMQLVHLMSRKRTKRTYPMNRRTHGSETVP